MLGFARIIGELLGTYVVQITGGVFACIAASEVYGALATAAAPVSKALGG